MKGNFFIVLIVLLFFATFESNAIDVTSTGSNFSGPNVCSDNVYSFVATPGLTNYVWEVRDSNNEVVLTGSGITFTINGGLSETIMSGMFIFPNSINVLVSAFNGVSNENWSSGYKTVKGSPSLQLMADASFCPNSTVFLSNLTTPGSGSYSYNWYFNNSIVAFSTNATHTATTAGIYKLEISEIINQCISTDEVTLIAQPAPVLLGINTPQFKCYSVDYQFNISTPSQLHWPITCNWTGANSPLSFSNSQNILSATSNTNPMLFSPLTPVVRAPSNITVEATNNKGCKTTAVINIVFNLPITGGITTPNNSILCKFGNYTLANDVAGGTGVFTYLWSPNDGLENVNVSNPKVLPQSEIGTLYTLEAKDSRNCTVSSSVTIKKSTLGLSFKNHNSDAITRCIGTIVPIEVGRTRGVSGFTIAAPGLLAQGNDSTYITPAITGDSKFIVTVTDNAGCTDKDSLVITAVAAPISNLPNKNWCPKTPLQVDATPTNITDAGVNFNYDWTINKPDFSSTSISNPIINTDNLVENQIKEYTVKVSKADEPDCNATTSFSITGLSSFDLKIDRNVLSNELLIETTIPFKSNGSGLDSLTWYFADFANTKGFGFETSNRYDSARVYIVTHSGLNASKCLSKDTISLKIKRPSTRKIYIPNVFLPASSLDANNSFKIFCDDTQINTTSLFSAKVFNIFGKVVYETSSFQEMKTKGWSGEGYNSGTYSYIIEGKFADESDFKIPGSVTMIR